MKTTTTLLLLVLSFVMVACGQNNESGKKAAAPQLNTLGTGIPTDMPVYRSRESSPEELIERLNDCRARRGLTMLMQDPGLDSQAKHFAVEIVEGGVAPGRVLNAGLCERIRGFGSCTGLVLDAQNEEIAINYWLNKDSNLLLNGDYRRAGASRVRDRNGRMVWVLLMVSR